MQNLVDVSPKSKQIQLVEDAAFVLGILRTKIEFASTAKAFSNRQKIRESVLSARLEEKSTDEFRLLATAIGLPLRAQLDFGGLSMSLEIFNSLNTPLPDILALERPDEISKGIQHLHKAWQSAPRRDLLTLATMLSDPDDNIAIGPAGRAFACQVLSGPEWLNGAFISVTEGLQGAPSYRAHDEPHIRVERFLTRLTKAAKSALRKLDDLNDMRNRWMSDMSVVNKGSLADEPSIARKPQRRRKNSKMPMLVDYILENGIVFPAEAARALGLKKQSMAEMFLELQLLGLVVPLVNRHNWKAYVVKDFALGSMDQVVLRDTQSGNANKIERDYEDTTPPPKLDLSVTPLKTRTRNVRASKDIQKDADDTIAEFDRFWGERELLDESSLNTDPDGRK